MKILSRPFAVLVCASLLTAMACSGCARHEPTTARESQPTATRAGAAPAIAVNERATEAPAAEKTLGLTEESEGAAEPIAGRSAIAAAVASNIPAPPALDSGRWVEGKHYVKLVTAEPTHVAPGRIEVLEVFWYGCAHCFHLDPALEAWRKKGKSPYVDFARSHVMWNPTTLAHAKLFYTIKALDKLEELHALVFREIHVNGNFLAAADPDTTEKLQRAFLKDHGVPEAAFTTAYHSFSVDNDLRQAEDTTRRYRVTGVPFLIVNGKYTTDVAQAGGEDELVALLDYLTAAEHKR